MVTRTCIILGGGCFSDPLGPKVKDLKLIVKVNMAKCTVLGDANILKQCFSEYVLSSTCIRITWLLLQKYMFLGLIQANEFKISWVRTWECTFLNYCPK